MKKLVKKSVNYSLSSAKKVIQKNPRIKNYVKSAINQHVQTGTSALTIKLARQLAYSQWVVNNYPDAVDIVRQKEESERFNYKPLISIIVPTYNTPTELLKECLDSVLGQTYENWELCVVDDASPDHSVKEVLEEYSKSDSRIKLKFRTTNGHISAASNDALSLAKGEFVALLDHDDLLWPNALHEAVKVINNKPKAEFIYTDEDKVTEDRFDHKYPFFKPDWNPEFLESVNYITHFAIIKKSLVEKVGGFNSECNGAQDWDLFLRVTEKTKYIEHIPKVLYSWRITDNSTAKSTGTKPYVVEAQRKALLNHFGRTKADVALQAGVIKDYWQAKYKIPGNPLVSIVIPTKNQYKILKRCIDSILQITEYRNYEIVIVDTGSDDRAVLNYYERLIGSNKNIKIIDWSEKPFSYSRSCNEGAKAAKGEYVLMLNNDTEVLQNDWIEQLLSDAQRSDVGAVGCKLFYPDARHIQHAGTGIGIGGVAANLLAMVPDNQLTQIQHLYANTRHQVTAVTAACLLVGKDKFFEVGGFDESLRVTYNDVDLCLKLHDKGYRNIYTPHVTLLHHESISVGRPEEAKKRDTSEIKAATKLFKKRWKRYIESDPHFNANFDRATASIELPLRTVD